jgi:hypothetical protein
MHGFGLLSRSIDTREHMLCGAAAPFLVVLFFSFLPCPLSTQVHRHYIFNSIILTSSPGVRYIMIKSWCSDNVTQAMKDGLWATQEKNQGLLTEAFHTSRHVILLFSVNRSMAFQGYVRADTPIPPLQHRANAANS